jgi:hypothetical protein
MSEQTQMLYLQHRTVQDQFTYFLLATAAAALAFAVQKTLDMKFTWSMIPLAGAVGCWGLSFFFGCKHLGSLREMLWNNAEYLQLQEGDHSRQPSHPQERLIAIDVMRQATYKGSARSGTYSALQFRTMILGGALFIGWHVYEMYLRSVTPAV